MDEAAHAVTMVDLVDGDVAKIVLGDGVADVDETSAGARPEAVGGLEGEPARQGDRSPRLGTLEERRGDQLAEQEHDRHHDHTGLHDRPHETGTRYAGGRQCHDLVAAGEDAERGRRAEKSRDGEEVVRLARQLQEKDVNRLGHVVTPGSHLLELVQEVDDREERQQGHEREQKTPSHAEPQVSVDDAHRRGAYGPAAVATFGGFVGLRARLPPPRADWRETAASPASRKAPCTHPRPGNAPNCPSATQCRAVTRSWW